MTFPGEAERSVWVIESCATASLEKAKALSPSDPGRRTHFHISDQTPYFLGKDVFTIDAQGRIIPSRRYEIKGWQSLSVMPQSTQAELIKAWQQTSKKRTSRYHGPCKANWTIKNIGM